MFTGIVKGIGVIARIKSLGNRKILSVKMLCDIYQLKPGESIAINGVCLTITDFDNKKNCFTVGVIQETLILTTLDRLKVNDKVNLEASLKVGDNIGGHFVTGHVDSSAEIASLTQSIGTYKLWIKPPKILLKFISPKGSVSLDGMSLTVVSVDQARCLFSVSLIPYTLENTIASCYKKHTRVNLEVDMFARYLNRLLETNSKIAS